MRLLAALGCVLVSLLVMTAPTGGIGVAEAPGAGATTPDEFGVPAEQAPQLTAEQVPQLAAVDIDVENATEPVQVMDVQLQQNGDADWTVTVWFPLDDAGDERAFERLADEFERGSSEATISIDVFETVAASIASDTDRSMEIRDVSRTTNATNTTGALSLEFTWTNFARAEAGTIRLGDVFGSNDGAWLPELGDGQHLVIRAPGGYAVDSASMAVREGTMHIEGPTRLESGTVEAIYVPSSDVGFTPDPSPSPSPSTPSTGSESAVAVFTVAVIVALALLFLARRWGAPLPTVLPAWIRQSTDEGEAAPNVSGRDGTSAGDDAPDFPDAPPTSVDVGDASDVEGAFTDVDLELLSDEERVIHLLERNGGRMKQATIVKETDWSNAKVSQLLSSMAEEETVEKLRIGRENLITLVDPDGEMDATVGDRG